MNHFGAGGTNLSPVLLYYKTDKACGATVSKEGVLGSGGEDPPTLREMLMSGLGLGQ